MVALEVEALRRRRSDARGLEREELDDPTFGDVLVPLVVFHAERIRVGIRELGLGARLLEDTVERKRAVERLRGSLPVCRCGNQRERRDGGANQSAHQGKGTLGRVNPRLLFALFLAGVFAIAAAAYAIVESRDQPPDVAYEGFAGSLLPDGVRAPGFELTDEREDTIAMRDFRGEPVIVTFLYTH